jgi:2'-5' RNA ligase
MTEQVSTIGVAIAIPQPYGDELQRFRASFGDPQADAIPTHITLVPPTEVKGDLEPVRTHLAEVARRHLAFPFHPHVTVAHDVAEDALDLAYETLADYEASFEVDSFHLYVHGADGLWRAAADYVLDHAASAPTA